MSPVLDGMVTSWLADESMFAGLSLPQARMALAFIRGALLDLLATGDRRGCRRGGACVRRPRRGPQAHQKSHNVGTGHGDHAEHGGDGGPAGEAVRETLDEHRERGGDHMADHRPRTGARRVA